ncbi:1-acyl-sn-glycerol-3-phosphate acyltransferase [Terribacillus saccharophilus]|jgi:1-acyl-sn-glycerol-3-phosphate acyltransferase|uniref:1-acyl-sn-glycerol-3-phosphate acyltransferase n=1 Tax=Terribacillus saccharophilus TaxID=361277 RepID=A0A268HFH6_9BACI|nr:MULTISPECIES: lysophospholipid acyltransferase family protein [Terribacillus]PAD36784.1 1-acyl-sn-glycerol-3-phosphate acyltransferase [Terribacillus saccharophilus]PAD97767.1 1-acyl-sn-glycerol-3-phosphate acyltransferase [Terribacillus saccharophilus]PAE01149.1 1-acyl-sn-glycerol-3-phosphate acyltransferase [Terribacillus saccharophilus]PAE08639.1 1-acyl-sn-glycerol-3-phosphate acyltransferase [Terribacillus saccharophilus]
MSLYTIGKMILSAAFYPMFRIKVYGKEHVPKEGPVLVCSNHISNFDPPILGITCPRDIAFMGKSELFKPKPLGWLMKNLNVFPVKRGMQDRGALRVGLDILAEGKTMGLFPEGTRSKDGKLGSPLPGIGFFAMRSEAKVVPCAIIGSYKGVKALKVIYGPPIDMEELKERKAPAKEVSEVIMDEIQLLINKHVG